MPFRLSPKRFLAAVPTIVACLVAGAVTAAAADPEDRWPDIKDMLFGDRPIADADGVVDLEAPYRAYDAAIVPITVKAAFAQTPERFIKTIHIVIDENPAPVAGVFHLTGDSGIATISTRVRVESYTNIRAIAETNDGALYMSTKYVKASGGCSAPSMKDAKLAMSRLGKMKLKQTRVAGPDEPNQAQILISHPNFSGLQFDQISRNFIPPHYVHKIRISHDDRTILTVDGDISLSEDPSIHFYYVPLGPGEIRVEVLDTEGGTFTGSWPVSPKADS